MPDRLMMGPCIEVWAEYGALSPQFSALRRWQAAVEAWAAAVDFERPLCNARNLARTRHAWSRDALIDRGDQAAVTYLETGKGDRPHMRQIQQWSQPRRRKPTQSMTDNPQKELNTPTKGNTDD